MSVAEQQTSITSSEAPRVPTVKTEPTEFRRVIQRNAGSPYPMQRPGKYSLQVKQSFMKKSNEDGSLRTDPKASRRLMARSGSQASHETSGERDAQLGTMTNSERQKDFYKNTRQRLLNRVMQTSR